MKTVVFAACVWAVVAAAATPAYVHTVDGVRFEGTLTTLQDQRLTLATTNETEAPYEIWLGDVVRIHLGSDGAAQVVEPSPVDGSDTVTIVPAGSIWRYYDKGEALPSAWRVMDYDDSAWESGPAQLGYGDGDEATVVAYGKAEAKHITTYFRHTLINDASQTFDRLFVDFLRDDGGVVYLNGVEVLRANLPRGKVDFNTLATPTIAGDRESEFPRQEIDHGLLLDGRNVLAVEIHQGQPTSSDISFDLRLSGAPSRQRTVTKSPEDLSNWHVALKSGGRLTGKLISWSVSNLVVDAKMDVDRQERFEVPLSAISKVWRLGADEPDDQEGGENLAGDVDTVFVEVEQGEIRNVSGIVDALDDGKLGLHYQGKDRKIGFDSVLSAILDRKSPDRDPGKRFHQLLVFRNDQVLPGIWLGLSGDAIVVNCLWGQPGSFDLSSIKEIRMQNSKLRFLSEITPTDIEQVPFFDRVIPYRADRSLSGKEIRLEDVAYERGVSMHSRTQLTYKLGGKYERFMSKLGFEHEAHDAGNVSVRVLGDEKVLFEIETYTRGDEVRDIDLDVRDIDEFVLEVDFGGGQDVGDQIVWANARLIASDIGDQASVITGQASEAIDP